MFPFLISDSWFFHAFRLSISPKVTETLEDEENMRFQDSVGFDISVKSGKNDTVLPETRSTQHSSQAKIRNSNEKNVMQTSGRCTSNELGNSGVYPVKNFYFHEKVQKVSTM